MKISNPNLISRRLQFSFSKVHEKEVKSLTSADISFIMNEVLRVKSEVEIKANRKLSINELMAFISINALMVGQPTQRDEHSLNTNDAGMGHDMEDAAKGDDAKQFSDILMLPSNREAEELSSQQAIAPKHNTIQEHSPQEECEEEAEDHLVDAGSIFGDQGVSAMFDFSQK